jgi:hypothetical protein
MLRRVSVSCALAALLAALASARAAAPTVTVKPGEALWFSVEGAPAGGCGGRDDHVRTGRSTIDELEIVYEAAFPADCGAAPLPPATRPHQIVVEGLAAATYNLTVTGGVAVRAEPVRAVRLAPGDGEAMEVPIIDTRTTAGRCAAYIAPDSPDEAVVLYESDMTTAAGRCIPIGPGLAESVVRATWASAPKGLALFFAFPLKPGPIRYGDGSMGAPTRFIGLHGDPGTTDLGPGRPPWGKDAGAAGGGPIGGAGGAAATRTATVAGMSVSITGELHLGDRPKLLRPGIMAAEGTMHLFIDNTTSAVQTVKIIRAWVVDATGWARHAHTVPKSPPVIALSPGETISVGLGLRKLPTMLSGSSWTLRVDLVAAGALQRVESGPVVVGAFR